LTGAGTWRTKQNVHVNLDYGLFTPGPSHGNMYKKFGEIWTCGF